MKQLAVVFTTFLLLGALATGCKKDAESTEGASPSTTTETEMKKEGATPTEPPQAAKPAVPAPTDEAATDEAAADEPAADEKAAAGTEDQAMEGEAAADDEAAAPEDEEAAE